MFKNPNPNKLYMYCTYKNTKIYVQQVAAANIKYKNVTLRN